MVNILRCSRCRFYVSSKNPMIFFYHMKFHSPAAIFRAACKYCGYNFHYSKYVSFRRHWNKLHESTVHNNLLPSFPSLTNGKNTF